MTGVGRLLIVLGIVLVVVGLAITLAGRANVPLGRLPGDITWRGKHTVVFFPLTTSIIISVVLTLVLYIVTRFRR